MKNAELIREFGREVGLPDLRLSKEGTLALTVGEDLEIVLEEEDGGEALDVCGIVGPLPSTSGHFLTALLTANHGGSATGGSALAIDPQTSLLTLCLRIGTSRATGESLARELDRFAGYLAFWSGHATEMATNAADGPPVRLGDDLHYIARP